MEETRSRPYRAGRWFGRALVILGHIAMVLALVWLSSYML